MASKLPYVAQPGSIVRIFEKVKQAQTPERFTVDFLETKLGFRGGNYRQFIPLAKKLGFLGSDGRPTEIYKRFRNDATAGAAMAQALRTGYREVFERNEFAGDLKAEDFKGMIVEITGLESKNRVVQLICQTFQSLKKLANFAAVLPKKEEGTEKPGRQPHGTTKEEGTFDLNLSYTINLVLPKTDDPAVFNAIFRSPRENLLRR